MQGIDTPSWVTTVDRDSHVAILTVNGGKDPDRFRWLELQLDRIRRCSANSNYSVWIWNNNRRDTFVETLAKGFDNVQAFTSPLSYSHVSPSKIHGISLQYLYRRVAALGFKYLVLLDTDAFPVKPGWLSDLTAYLEAGNDFVGVWRDEMSEFIEPYIHPSCFFSTFQFVEQNRIRFDRIDGDDSGRNEDTLSHLTRLADAKGWSYHKLHRSNRRNYHFLMSGIYGDLIYHHGAGSRVRPTFATENKKHVNQLWNQRIQRKSCDLLADDCDEFIEWLRGGDASSQLNRKVKELTALTGQMPLDLWAYRLAAKAGTMKTARQLAGATKSRLLSTRTPIKAWMSITDWTRVVNHRQQSMWRPRPPDFVGIGVAKCGTSWFYSNLVKHPEVAPHRLYEGRNSDELNLFTRLYNEEMTQELQDSYFSLFAAPDGAICGEFDTRYLHYPDCMEKIRAIAPHAKIMILLRNPVDRFYSHINHVAHSRAQALRLSDSQLEFFVNSSAVPEATLFSQYAPGLKRAYEIFGEENVYVMQFEKLIRSPHEEFRKVFEYLGVDPDYQVNGLSQPKNKQSEATKRVLGEVRARNTIAKSFLDDVSEIQKIVPSLDFSLWREFR